MKVKIIDSEVNETQDEFEAKVNEFIKNKKVISISMNNDIFFRVLIAYE